MWRNSAAHARRETEFLNDAIDRILRGRAFLDAANRTLEAEAGHEPLIADALRTPQTPAHHAEGPFVEDHLRLQLQILYAVLGEKLHLVDIEEFSRMSGYQGEVEEMEEIIKENASLFETFVLCHDASKWSTIYFDASAGGRGRALGFSEDTAMHREDAGISVRTNDRARYVEAYDAFAAAHPHLSRTEAQAEFYLLYGIEAHYAGHDKAIRSPVYRALLERVAARRDLPARDVDLLETIIAHHLDPIADFSSVSPNALLRYHALAAKHGYDADDFVDLLQGCVFLDTVCGSRQLSVRGPASDAGTLARFLQSEHDFAPWRRAEKERVREDRRKRALTAVFRDVGLDGVGLMDLLRMDPGPKFGAALRSVHEAISAGAPLPKLGKGMDEELERRVAAYAERVFEKGE